MITRGKTWDLWCGKPRACCRFGVFDLDVNAGWTTLIRSMLGFFLLEVYFFNLAYCNVV